MGKLTKRQLADGLAKIEHSQLPGKHKVWCYQHILYQRILWPLKVCEVASSEVSRMDSLANSFIRKWLGLPRCFSDVGLFGWNMLELPIKSISIGYKQEKALLVLELKNSADPLIRSANVPICTGRKWKAQAEVDHAISSLQHREVMKAVQSSRAGLGWGAAQQPWSKATRRQQKTMVVDEITRLEQERFHVKAISQGTQGAWTRWEATINRRITWADIWRTPQSRLSFLLRATYDTLPCPRNLTLWYGEEVGCHLCGSVQGKPPTHFVGGCRVALTQGRLRWRHDQILAKLAEILEGSRVAANQSPLIEEHALAGCDRLESQSRKDHLTCTTNSLDEPWRLRVVAAQAYSIMKNRDIKMFERVMEFLDITYKLLPQLVPPIKHMKIMFGLKTMIIMWMVQEDQGIVNTVVKTMKFFPSRLPQYQGCRQHEINLMRKNQWDFKALAQTLAMDQSFRQAYIKDVMEEQYGECYAQKLEDRLMHYLQELESALQSETYVDRLLKHRAPMEYKEELLLSLITSDSISLAALLKRLLHSAQSTSRCWPSHADRKVGVVLPLKQGQKPEVTVLQSPRESALKVQSQLNKTSSNPPQGLCQHNPPERSDSLDPHHAEQGSNPQTCMVEPGTGQSKGSPLVLEDEYSDGDVWDLGRTDEGLGGRPNSEVVQENPPMQLCSKHQKWVRSILQECSEELHRDQGDYNPELESVSASSLDLTPSLTALFPP
ncbi:hypothetical protein UPYG_G00263980 [Umbra pygmaea]|uniref:TERF1-interacting nuclear factor 2 N-terminal domain-containing protein n=1 Tax=Umbra pygmaea TaxID=75934 RepID=A0ABD0WB29_UMBPY